MVHKSFVERFGLGLGAGRMCLGVKPLGLKGQTGWCRIMFVQKRGRALLYYTNSIMSSADKKQSALTNAKNASMKNQMYVSLSIQITL